LASCPREVSRAGERVPPSRTLTRRPAGTIDPAIYQPSRPHRLPRTMPALRARPAAVRRRGGGAVSTRSLRAQGVRRRGRRRRRSCARGRGHERRRPSTPLSARSRRPAPHSAMVVAVVIAGCGDTSTNTPTPTSAAEVAQHITPSRATVCHRFSRYLSRYDYIEKGTSVRAYDILSISSRGTAPTKHDAKARRGQNDANAPNPRKVALTARRTRTMTFSL
jgi:hypothetical protein